MDEILEMAEEDKKALALQLADWDTTRRSKVLSSAVSVTASHLNRTVSSGDIQQKPPYIVCKPPCGNLHRYKQVMQNGLPDTPCLIKALRT